MFNAAPTQPKADIKIFGSYCHRCQVFKQAVEQIVQELATEAQIECLSEISASKNTTYSTYLPCG